jgi:hypothetical protein
MRHDVRVADEVLSPGRGRGDPDLATAMARLDVRVEEELFLDTLLADLA